MLVNAPHLAEPYRMFPVEFEVAKLFNGERTVEQVREQAHVQGYPVNDGQVLQFLEELEDAGLVRNATTFAELQSSISAQGESLSVPEILDGIDLPQLDADTGPEAPGVQNYVEIAQAVAAQGDFESARYYLLAALERNPESQAVKNFLMTLGPIGNVDREAPNPIETPKALGTGQGMVVHQTAEQDLAPVPTGQEFDEQEPQLPSTEVRGIEDAPVEEAAKKIKKSLTRKRIELSAKRAVVGVIGVAIAWAITSQIPWHDSIQAEVEIGEAESRSIVATGTGVIKGLNALEGDFVKKGDLLVEVDSPETRLQIQQLTAKRDEEREALLSLQRGTEKIELTRLKDNLRISLMQRAGAARELKRMEASRDMFSNREVEAARNALFLKNTDVKRAKSELNIAKAGNRDEVIAIQEAHLKIAEAELELAEKQLEHLIVRAPIDGIVALDKETKLYPGSAVSKGQTLFSVVDSKTAKVEMRVIQAEISLVKLGAEVSFWLSARPGERFEGTVTAISPTTAEDSDLFFIVYSEIDNPGGVLRPGMKGRGKISAGDTALWTVLSRPVLKVIRGIVYGV